MNKLYRIIGYDLNNKRIVLFHWNRLPEDGIEKAKQLAKDFNMNLTNYSYELVTEEEIHMGMGSN